MKLTDNENNFVDVTKDIKDFTMAELFAKTTKCQKLDSSNYDYAFRVEIPNAVNVEVDLLEKVINKFQVYELIERRAKYIPLTQTYCFYDANNQIIEHLNSNMISWSTNRYYKTDKYKYFESHKYKTRKEIEEQKEKRRKFWHDWAPLLVSTVALLLTALPSFLNFVFDKKQTVVIEYENNIVQKIESQEKEIIQLKEEINKLTKNAK